MESDDKPVLSPMTLAHTVTATHEGGYAAPGDLDDEQKAAACEVLACAKTMLLGEECAPPPPPTSREKEVFLSDVFHMWERGTEQHPCPDSKTLVGGLRDRSVEVATLSHDVPTDKEVKEELKRRGISTAGIKGRAFKHMLEQNAAGVRTNCDFRRRGAPVLMRAQLNSNLVIDTSFLAKNGDFLSPFVKKTWLPGIDLNRAYRMVFRRFDLYETTNVNDYNIKVAVFLARNRITHWDNGRPVKERPSTENLDLIVRVRTIRLMARQADEPSMQSAYANLNSKPEYTIYQGLPSTEDGHADVACSMTIKAECADAEDASKQDAN